MEFQAMAIPKTSNSDFMNGPPCAALEMRLFFVRFAPCAVDVVPDHLKLCHVRHETGVSLDINGLRIPASGTGSLTLRRDRVDKESSEVTYVSTDSVRVSGASSSCIDFEVFEKEDMILCGSLERMEPVWGNASSVGRVEKGSEESGWWSMDCYMASSITSGSSAFFQPKRGISSPSVEVYIAGRCSGRPLILTKTLLISPRRKASKHTTLNAIPEDEETTEKEHKCCNGSMDQPKLQITEAEIEGYESDGKVEHGIYSEDMYLGEDGQLTWFNAGVRVGVGIGLGMCLGIGIGVGLLMRSYQTTTRNLRRRFL